MTPRKLLQTACVICALFLFAENIFAQKNKIDSFDALIENTETPHKKVKLANQKARLLISEKKYEEAVSVLMQYLDLLPEKSEPQTQADIYITLAKALSLRGEKTKALEYYFRVTEMQSKIKTKTLSDTYFEIAFLYIKIGALDQSLEYFNKSNDVLPDTADPVAKAQTITNIAYVYHMKGDYETALKKNLEALTVFEKHKDSSSIAYAINNIGALYRKLKNFDLALDYYKRAFKLKTAIKDTASLTTTYNNIGVVYEQTKKFKKAEEYYRKALEVAQKYKDQMNIARLLNSLGRIHEEYKQPDKAQELYFQSLDIKRKISDKHGIITSYLNIGRFFRNKNQTQKAKQYFKEAIHLADSLGFIKELSVLYKEMSLSYEESGNPAEALKYFKKYTEINDTLLNAEKQKNLKEMEVIYETKAKERKLKYLKAENQAKEKILKQNNRIQIILVVILILSTALFVSFLKRHRLKTKNKTIALQQNLLRTQMNPHFIFNSLSSIQAYIYENEALKAGKYLSDFAALMRMILYNSRNEYISPESEIKTLELYLKLQRKRFNNKFDYSITNNIEKDSASVLIPPMLAQPVIENAIEHGVRKLKKKGEINIKYTPHKKGISLEITDNGLGLNRTEKPNQNNKKVSYALQIIKERLALYHKSQKKFVYLEELKQNEEITGMRVRLIIPCKKQKL